MATIDLSDYNLGELKGLQVDIDNELRNRRRQEVEAARASIAAIAEETGLSIDDVLRSKAASTRKS